MRSSAKAELFVCPELGQIVEFRGNILTFPSKNSKIMLARIEYHLIKSDGGYRPCEVRQPAVQQGAKSCGVTER